MLILPLFFVGFVFFFTIYGPKIKKWYEFRSRVNEIPKVFHWPIVGDVKIIMANAHELFILRNKRLKNRSGPLLGWLFHVPLVALYEAEDVEKILSNIDQIEKSIIYTPLLPWLKTGLLTSTGQKWHHRRKILTPAFHFTILQEFLKIFHSESKRLVESLRDHANEEVDIKPLITKFTLFSICETAMGISLGSMERQAEYFDSIHKVGNIFLERVQKIWLMIDFFFYFSKSYWIQRRLLKSLHSFSSKLIAQRKKYIQEIMKHNTFSYSERKRVAMLDLLLMHQIQNGDIDDEGIREEVDTFMFEGHDTTALSLIYTLMLLANNKECQDRVYEEILAVIGDGDREPTNADLQNLRYMELCIKESLRLYPSVPSISRATSSDVQTESGVIIPAGCNVIIEIFDLHRRTNVFPDPEKFDPDRFLPENVRGRHPFAYIPFSGGPRNCIGQKFAMMELKCGLLEILKAFKLEPVDGPESIKLMIDIVLRSEEPIRVRFVPRK